MDNKELQMAPAHLTSAPHSNIQHFVTESSVCTKEISFAVDNGSIDYVDFGGGCEGNLKAIANMIEGMSVDFVLDRFSGITCGSKSTSCVDQLCHALTEHMEQKQSN
jgi:uncharacterized protein (TIGR03905 family)